MEIILLIDDDFATNYLHKRILIKSGFCSSIMIANNGQEGIDALMELNLNNEYKDAKVLIILDINMPIMDGWSFLKEYGQIKESFDIETVVFMVSSSINPDDRARAERCKLVTKFMSKPLTKECLALLKDGLLS